MNNAPVDDFQKFFVLMQQMDQHMEVIELHTKALTGFRTLDPKAEAELTNRIVDTVDRRLADIERGIRGIGGPAIRWTLTSAGAAVLATLLVTCLMSH